MEFFNDEWFFQTSNIENNGLEWNLLREKNSIGKAGRLAVFLIGIQTVKKIGSADGFRILQEFRSKFQSLCFAQLMSSLRNTKTNSNSNLLTFLFLYYLVPTHSFWFDLVENIDHGLILWALNFDLSLSRIEKLLLNILLQKSMKKNVTSELENWLLDPHKH